MIQDTCFPIDLQREIRTGQEGRATAFLKTHKETHMHISVVTETEFLEGFAQVEAGERLLRCYDRIGIDSRIARQAAIIRRGLRLTGELIGDFDILIAATAIVEEMPLVTKDTGHFERVHDLEIAGY